MRSGWSLLSEIKSWSLFDLELLCKNNAEESSDLEFKESMSLSNNDGAKKELCKDVSGMANAAGGNIIYGIVENSVGVADHIDSGSSPFSISSEWINQVLTSGIEPKVPDVEIASILLSNGNKVFVISIPQSTTFAPHQVKNDKKYYRRTDKRVEPMQDYEIRDIMLRGTKPRV